MNKTELQKLKNKLPKGYRATIKERTGFSFSYIDQIFTGIRQNQEIIDAAFKILEEYKEKLNQQKKILEHE